jgi:hypothetical protein
VASLTSLRDLRRGAFRDTSALAYAGRQRIGDFGAIGGPAPIMTTWPSRHASHFAPHVRYGRVSLVPNIHRAPFDGEACVRCAARQPRACWVTVTLVRLLPPCGKCGWSRSDISDLGVTMFLNQFRLINQS